MSSVTHLLETEACLLEVQKSGQMLQQKFCNSEIASPIFCALVGDGAPETLSVSVNATLRSGFAVLRVGCLYFLTLCPSDFHINKSPMSTMEIFSDGKARRPSILSSLYPGESWSPERQEPGDAGKADRQSVRSQGMLGKLVTRVSEARDAELLSRETGPFGDLVLMDRPVSLEKLTKN